MDRFTKIDEEVKKVNRICDNYMNIYLIPYNRGNNAVENYFYVSYHNLSVGRDYIDECRHKDRLYRVGHLVNGRTLPRMGRWGSASGIDGIEGGLRR